MKITTEWKTLTKYLADNGKGPMDNRSYYLSRIPGHFRQKNRNGDWMIAPECPDLKDLNAKGTPDPRHPVGAPRKTTNGKDGK